MEKVKVSRYVTGKRPEYAPDTSDEEDDEQIEFSLTKQQQQNRLTSDADHDVKLEAENYDRRLRRLQGRQIEEVDSDDDREARVLRHRQLLEPEVLVTGGDDVDIHRRDETSDEEEEELDDEEIERRRELLRQKVRVVKKEEEVLGVEDEKESGDEEEGQDHDDSSEYEEYSGSEEEDAGPRLKPVFVRKKDRITIQEKERELQKQKELESDAKRSAEQRRQQTLKMVEQEVRRELEQERQKVDACDAIDSDAENDEEEYEAWKVRELKRIKRDREERENMEREKQELERLHNMTEEERRQELKLNPKVVTNKASKGKYKFLQKYYHRGAFFLDKEDEVLKRDFSAPTLEDHFEKTVLPKVMQVKNFGRSGRTKYTHLVDQDTTQFDAPWADNSALNIKFHSAVSAGMKQSFERPTVKKRK